MHRIFLGQRRLAFSDRIESSDREEMLKIDELEHALAGQKPRDRRHGAEQAIHLDPYLRPKACLYRRLGEFF